MLEVAPEDAEEDRDMALVLDDLTEGSTSAIGCSPTDEGPVGWRYGKDWGNDSRIRSRVEADDE